MIDSLRKLSFTVSYRPEDRARVVVEFGAVSAAVPIDVAIAMLEALGAELRRDSSPD